MLLQLHSDQRGRYRTKVDRLPILSSRVSDFIPVLEWNPVDRGVALQSGNPLAVFTTAKTLAEKAIWDFASSHPHVEVTTSKAPIVLDVWSNAESL